MDNKHTNVKISGINNEFGSVNVFSFFIINILPYILCSNNGTPPH